MNKRNISADCENCSDNNKAISDCFDVCSAPITVLSDMEKARNDKYNYDLVYRQALREICNLMHDCEYPEDLEMKLYDFMKDRGMEL